MAYIQTHQTTRTIVDTIAHPFRAVAETLMRLSEANIRVRQIAHFSEMSDAELARRGLKREDIVRHVYRGCL